MRIVTTTCSNTEIVCALGRAEDLVGVDHHSDHPPFALQRVARVGRDLAIDVDRVAALDPDLVLASLTVPGHEVVVERLEGRGLAVVVLEPIRLADIYRDITRVADLLGVPDAGAELCRQMQTELKPRTLPRRPDILVEWWPRPVIVPGRDSWVTDLLDLAGGRNPLDQAPHKSLPLPDPLPPGFEADAAVISWCGVDAGKYRPSVVQERAGWKHLNAVRRSRIFAIPEAHLGRPGPRVTNGYHDLCRVVDACLDGPGWG